jgi:hypothetical protein
MKLHNLGLLDEEEIRKEISVSSSSQIEKIYADHEEYVEARAKTPGT